MSTVEVAFTKWGGGAHWTFELPRLGADEYGVWVGSPPGLVLRRPGAEVVYGYASVTVIPPDAPWIATGFAPPLPGVTADYDMYIDMTTPPVWSAAGDRVTMVDLDLDVVRHWDGRVEVLDEDEFAEHQVELGYPAEIVALAEQSCAAQRDALIAGAEPFATVFGDWLARVSS